MAIANFRVGTCGCFDMRHFWLILLSFLGLTAAAVPASADITYQLNCVSDPCTTTGNFGSINLHQNGSGTVLDPYYVTVTVDLTTASSAEKFAGTGAGYAVTWNIAGNPTLSSVSVTSANAGNFTVQNFDPSDHSPPGPNYQRYKATPFTPGSCSYNDAGCMMYAIDYNIGGSGGNDSKLVFDVMKSGGLVLSDFTANSDGYFFTADVSGPGSCNPTCNVASNTTTAPEPGTVFMLLAGLGSLLMVRRRRQLVRAN